jgi:hypothetical protein
MNRSGINNSNYRGGKRIDKSGYVLIYKPDHPYHDPNNCVREHRLVLEEYYSEKFGIPIFILPILHVHHKNGIKNDNRIENLEIIDNRTHSSLHAFGKHRDISDRRCFNCGTDKTDICKPKGKLKTPCPHWNHLPHDKINWYCGICYRKENWKIKKSISKS